MVSTRKTFAIVSMGVSLVAFTALASADPKEETPKASSACSCCGGPGSEGGCCSQSADQPAQHAVLPAAARSAHIVRVSLQKKSSEPAKASAKAVEQGVATRKALLNQVSTLMDDGVADCCVGPGCALCPISADACDCAPSLAKGGPVCPECWGGWQAGHGMLPDVKPEQVKTFSSDILKSIYDGRAKKLEQAEKQK